MATNPGVPQGNLNRLRASVLWTSFPNLNVTASYLAPEAIRFAFDGDFSDLLGTLTGAVPSPAPYVMSEFTLNLVKSIPLANAYKQQWELNCNLGDATVRPDTNPLQPFYVSNCTILRCEELDFSGRSAVLAVRCKGTYYINASLWNI